MRIDAISGESPTLKYLKHLIGKRSRSNVTVYHEVKRYHPRLSVLEGGKLRSILKNDKEGRPTVSKALFPQDHLES